ncbi:hypothetical protein QEG73_21440 [Chitinophagaceae bacterium 26-R-25]|nr:hypothetical protein [Chitinophagaceae bacterium 26-R-25]
MKLIIKTTIILIALCMLAGTIMIFLPDIKILFTRESAAYLSIISDVNRTLAVIFFIGYLCIMVLVLRGFSTTKVLALLLVLVLWFLSGRVTAFKAFPDGRVITGWYYIETNSFRLCNENEDCESVLFKETKVKKLPLWCISIKNMTTKKLIFIGPFSWNSCIKSFEEHIGK